ncbi:MAG: hypothetical protein Q4F13_13760 [Pseudomonadota bacterium]|nr:hypothetical protein [Pseudomonadota bacterium]
MKPLSLLTPCFALAASLLAAAWPAAAQDRIYRCGNEYTNQVKGRKDCKLVEGGNVTVVRGTMPAAAAPAAAPARAAAPRSSGGGSSGTSSSAAAAPRIDTPEQRARDADARAILEQELRRAESRQAELLKAYNNGEPERQGNERNYQKYLDRVAEMKADIDRNQADIDGIKRELNRLR